LRWREKLRCCGKILEIVDGVVEQILRSWLREALLILEIVNGVAEQSVENTEMREWTPWKRVQ
jgi:hypothetical protein